MLVSLPVAAQGEQQRQSHRESTHDFQLDDFHSRLTGVRQMKGEIQPFRRGVSLHDRERNVRGFGMQLGTATGSIGEPDLEGIYRSHSYPAWGMPSAHSFKNEIWGGSLRTQVADGLRVQSEYAVSRKGHPALQRASEAEVTGQAYLLDAQYATALASWAGQPLVWEAGLDRRRADHAFWSPRSGVAVPGKRLDRVSSRLGWGDLSAALQYQHSRELPREGSPAEGKRADDLDLNLAYSLAVAPLLPGLQPVLGDELTLSMTRGRGTSFNPTTGTRHRSRRMAVEASFTPGRSRWSLRHSRTVRRDRESDAMLGSQTSTALHMRLPFTPALTVTPGIEWIESAEANHEYDTIIGTLGGAAGLVPGVLDTRLQLRARQRSSERRANDCVDVYAENDYDWTVRRAGRVTPRISFSMGGQYHYADQSSNCSRESERYVAFAGLEMRWSAR